MAEINPTTIPAGHSFYATYSNRRTRGMAAYHYNLNHYELVILMHGTMYCYIGADVYTLLSGDEYASVAIMDIGVDHRHTYDPSESAAMYHVFFNDDYIRHFFDLTGVRLLDALKPPYVMNINAASAIHATEYLNRMIHTSPDAFTEAYDTSLLDAFFIELIRAEHQPIGTGLDRGKEAVVLRIVRYIDRNYTQNLSLQSIAKDFSISKEYLSRLFKSCTGLTVNGYIRQTRLKYACLFLKETHDVTAVAAKVGFSSESYFIECFREAFGTTPRKYSLLSSSVSP